MKHGTITLAAVSCRAEGSHKSEQINQLLFGDLYVVMEESPDWIKVESDYDGYQGWIHRKHHTPISESLFNKLSKQSHAISLELLGRMKYKKSNQHLNIPLGSSLIPIEGLSYKGRKAIQKKTNRFKYAMLYLNSPYLWGGRTPFGIDCSGFMQMTHKLAGIQLPRDSWQQALLGKKIKKFASAKKGDLCFFGDGVKITHVGLMLGSNKIIHASGKVRIDTIDERGIFNEELQKYTHRLKSISRLS